MKLAQKILIGGKALVELGSSRSTNDTDYLINDTETNDMFIIDEENNIDYLNANGNKFFNEIFSKEKGNKTASAQSLFELKAFAFVQHCQNFKFQKVADCEFDLKFLSINFDVESAPIVKKYISTNEYLEILKIIKSAKLK